MNEIIWRLSNAASWLARRWLLCLYVIGLVAAVLATLANWTNGRRAWADIPCVVAWPICMTYATVDRHFRQPVYAPQTRRR